MIAEQLVRVIVATESREVRRLLESRPNVSFEISVHTAQISSLLSEAHLLVIDYEDLVEFGLDKAALREEVFGSRVYECTSEDFLADPASYLSGRAVNRAGKMLSLPETYTIAFVSYSGGTGRTTLAMETAFAFAEGSRLHKKKSAEPDAEQVLLVEFSHGVSSLLMLTGLECPSLSESAKDPDVELGKHRGVTLLPMDYDFSRLLPSDLLEQYLGRTMEQHRLTVIDCLWPHGLADAISSQVNLWVVVASERPDAIKNAMRLHDELTARFHDAHVWLLMNRIPEGKENHRADEANWNIALNEIKRPDEFKGELGNQILAQVFAPIWKND